MKNYFAKYWSQRSIWFVSSIYDGALCDTYLQLKPFNYCPKKLNFRWQHEAGCWYSKYDFTITVKTVSVVNSFWIELDGIFCQIKINFTEQGPLPTSKTEPVVAIIDSWNLLTSDANSLDPPWLNYGFQRTEESCSNVNSLVVFVDGGRSLFVFSPNQKCNHDSNETILEILSIPEKALKALLNINVNAAARLAWGQRLLLQILFA